MNNRPPQHQERGTSSPHHPDRLEQFVFLDRRGKRWPRVRLLMFFSAGLLFIGIVLFVQALVLPSHLTLPAAVEQLKSRLKAQQGVRALPGNPVTKPLWLPYAKKGREVHPDLQPQTGTRMAALSPALEGAAPAVSSFKEIRLGFYEGWDPDSLDSLRAHGDLLTHVCTDWLTMDSSTRAIRVHSDPEALALIRENGLVTMPLLRNLGEDDAWQPEMVEFLINASGEEQDRFIADFRGALAKISAGGVILDWQQIDPAYKQQLTDFLARLAQSMHQGGMQLWLCVPTGREIAAYDLDQLSRHADHFVAMLHDENAEKDSAGPVASRDFYNGWLSTLVDGYGRPGQWIISLGSYGYDWTEGRQTAEFISFPDIMSRAGRSLQTSCSFHRPSLNPYFVYEDAGTVHTIWFLDAVTFLNQLTSARARQVGGIAVYRLGTEDPGIWDVLNFDPAHPPSRQELATLEAIRPGDAIAHIGSGNLVSIADERGDGLRRIHYPENASIGDRLTATYEKFPSYLTILHQGRGPADGAAITFDDGPDSDWTPQILDILKEKQVKATFFMIGANMEKHPEIVRRILAEGHMIGVHTYSHPNIAQVSEERAHLELNATQRLIESITGHSTILFRPPYNADTNPREPEELVPVKLAQAMGYATITEDIDPEDWDKPGVATILDRIKRGRQQGGNVILLHDAGGNREQTVAALPKIIDYLHNRGDTVLPLPRLLDIPAEELMPVVPANQQPWSRMISEGGFTAIHKITSFFWAFMIVATGLTIFKTLAVCLLAIRSRRRDRVEPPAAPAQDWPAISVLIAAYNEEKVIADTLRAVLDTAYPGDLEVVVVDDGSKDRTAEIVTAMAAGEPRLRLLRQVNLGKAMALRNGLAAISREIIVSLDADTQFTPQTIVHLVRPFADPAVGAVSGRARVGNPKTLVARFQALEYTCGFNLDRRAYHQLNCITVVPGAVSAFRKSAIAAAGGISNETLAEDTDLTLALHRCGYRVHYAPRAVAWTEAPETLGAFARQRFRWAFGTLQCLWKHRELLFNPQYPALGWFSLPSAWFFNIFLVAMGSIIDLTLVCSLIISPTNTILYLYFFIFLAADLFLAAVACLVEEEPLTQVWLVLPMRFIYRPVLNYVVIKVLFKAIKGAWVGWGKLDRTASVSLPAMQATKQGGL